MSSHGGLAWDQWIKHFHLLCILPKLFLRLLRAALEIKCTGMRDGINILYCNQSPAIRTGLSQDLQRPTQTCASQVAGCTSTCTTSSFAGPYPHCPDSRAVFAPLSRQGLLIFNLLRKWKSAAYVPSATGWPFCTLDMGAGRGLQRELQWFPILNQSSETERSILVVFYWFPWSI